MKRYIYLLLLTTFTAALIVLSSCQKKKRITFEKNLSYRFEFKAYNSLGCASERYVLINGYNIVYQEEDPKLESGTLYCMRTYIDASKSKDYSYPPPVIRDTLKIGLRRADYDSIYNFAHNFISNFKISNMDTVVNGVRKEMYRSQPGSRAIVMLGCRNRTIVAVVEEFGGIGDSSTKELMALCDYLNRLQERAILKQKRKGDLR